MTAKLYAEGGGPGQLYDTIVRHAWKAFFEKAGLRGRLPGIVRGEGRTQTFDLFLTAVNHPRRDELPLLLVDSESAVITEHTVWQHLKASDNWDKPARAADDSGFLMVQLMETWFLADREMLRSHFGAALREDHFHAWPVLEEVPKTTVLAALDNATAACARRYAKGKLSYELLEKVNPSLVEHACPHAKSLLDKLRSL